MKAALYARVSTVDKDQTTEVQLSKLRDYCQEMERLFIKRNGPKTAALLLFSQSPFYFHTAARAIGMPAANPMTAIRTLEIQPFLQVLNLNRAHGKVYVVNPQGQGFGHTAGTKEEDTDKNLVPKAGCL